LSAFSQLISTIRSRRPRYRCRQHWPEWDGAEQLQLDWHAKANLWAAGMRSEAGDRRLIGTGIVLTAEKPFVVAGQWAGGLSVEQAVHLRSNLRTARLREAAVPRGVGVSSSPKSETGVLSRVLAGPAHADLWL
jgi:hypothetical protein